MAVPHFSVGMISRGSGGSAIVSAAYRHCAKMTFDREARLVDYSRKSGLGHEEFAIPKDAPVWLAKLVSDKSVKGASEAFWNKLESFEKRADAQLAKDVTIALPDELSPSQNIALVRDFVEQHVTSRGMIADWVYHDIAGNPHVHMMTTLRPLSKEGFGAKKVAALGQDGHPKRNGAGKIIYQLWAGNLDDFDTFRSGWFSCQNSHLARAGLDIHIDGRSFERQGIELKPTIHLGVQTKAIQRKTRHDKKSIELQRVVQLEICRADNAQRFARRPQMVLDLITREKSVFEVADIAKILHRQIDDPVLFQNLMAQILQSPELLLLDQEKVDFTTGHRLAAKYTTRSMLRMEADMISRADWLSKRRPHPVSAAILQAVFDAQSQLSDEQRLAIRHVTGDGQIATVIGRAGAGKTTMMKAARQAWEAAGYTVVGAALAGKAAEGLQKEAGITAFTLASWELAWQRNRKKLHSKTVFVLDEAGMVSSRQMAGLVEMACLAGAKLVLIGDPDQLQPIEAGAAFRAIADRIGYRELNTIYRQQQAWMRSASLDLARGKIEPALEAYRLQAKLRDSYLKADAVSCLIDDWIRDYTPSRSSLMLAHLRRDVRLLNQLAREKLMEHNIIQGAEHFRTADGDRNFAVGEQIVFLRNETSLGVKNGMLAKVTNARAGRIEVEIGDNDHRRQVTVEQHLYNWIDHGYATTIHKSQGATVDQVKFLATLSLDRHLTYVAMTRHRRDLSIYYGSASFDKAGGLAQILGRHNAKTTTLDYAKTGFYGQALRFAQSRGLHIISVARTLLRDRIAWLERQRKSVSDLGQRLSKIGITLGLEPNKKHQHGLRPTHDPMLSGIGRFENSPDEAVESKLADNPTLKKQWQEVSTRFRLVYAQPETAFARTQIESSLQSEAKGRALLDTLRKTPEQFGDLKRQNRRLNLRNAGRADESARGNAIALARNLERYFRLRREIAQSLLQSERDRRARMAIDIPNLSPQAYQVLAEAEDALKGDTSPLAPPLALQANAVREELQRFAQAVCDRFGERMFLVAGSASPGDDVFETLAAGMTPAQRERLRLAWGLFATSQELKAGKHLDSAAPQTETARQALTFGALS